MHAMTTPSPAAPLLEVKNLEVSFPTKTKTLVAVRDVSFTLHRGERLGLVGESGAGKSITGFSILKLISRPGRISGGSILFEGRDLAPLSEQEMRPLRGDRISMIFQDPMMTLNPVLTIGTQMVETLQAHRRLSRREAQDIAIETLRAVRIPSPEKRMAQYPHQFSGGMRQRIVIAIALLTRPSLIIADEPTTALDVTIQAEILDLLLELAEHEGMGLLLITHDLAVVSQVTDRVAVMYAGRIVEIGPTEQVVHAPQHPYTQGLLAALPQTHAGEPGTGRLAQIHGIMPSLYNTPTGCAFHPRCPVRIHACSEDAPALRPCGQTGVLAACHLVE
ncbi:ABC transporter ATP-binding protein [Megalodesulfovibrio gigas]|uniref:Putative oligopeptide/dipeptide ABC transporter ATPase n=1 Tax=Megalodesulfovibrio gigas (strain ATCC 19364 / DSM 1382 / NCIMB 9332 / VKM B-1759) TaxID=1121448 RepID=T2G9M8_MEGG1|nr:ABC transporter ATP-binding protein [Megalodesulfovibrio gigas]AGW13300.1 putative oligopeptide/dipeptide ABC transporter ATPase [Megalodesulfovibrio gigas DSM 1382 = ATCC 19364]